MQDKFYSDNRDLVKWAILHRLADTFQAQRILQLAFYRTSKFPNVIIDGEEYDIPQEVLSHFRDLRTIENIKSEIQVTVFNNLFENREGYLKSAKVFLSKFREETCVVFLDPDTGLEPQKNPNKNHVLESEAKFIWDAIDSGDVYFFYQHQITRSKKPWIEPKRS